jgi:GT2 family glycosyltransferase
MVRAPVNESVCAIVVTHNRPDMLRGCLDALADQERPPQEVLVIDNASTDDTPDIVRDEYPWVQLLRMEVNGGGAGGFHRGIAEAHARGHDWLWVMDDDTFPVPDTLAALLAGAARASERPLLVASQVRWKDERLHPMNMPVPRWRDRAGLSAGVADGLLLLRNATFVSVAMRREVVDRFGLPLEHYFIWTDDVEYTSRILRNERGYLVPESRVYHWTPKPHTAVTDAGPRFYFHVRNSLLLLRGSSLSPIERLDYGRYYVRTLIAFLKAHGREREARSTLRRGLRDGLRDRVR